MTAADNATISRAARELNAAMQRIAARHKLSVSDSVLVVASYYATLLAAATRPEADPEVVLAGATKLVRLGYEGALKGLRAEDAMAAAAHPAGHA